MLLGNSNHCYLIDCITLADEMYKLSGVLEDSRIVKLMYNPGLTFQNIKRDFHIFPINHFDLKCLENYHSDLGHDESNVLLGTYKKLCSQLRTNEN